MSVIQGELSLGVRVRQGGTLVERALARLAQGPATTAGLAADVLALRGNPPVAAAAIFALLGTDDRFHVDRSGVWSLVTSLPPPQGPLLRNQDWVVVDVETTGGSPGRGHRIIEVAAVRVSGGKRVGVFSTLVNPLRRIPRMISSLTGITEEEVAQAPRFEEIAPALAEALDGRVFVGHNAVFDWNFVRAEMERCTGRTIAGQRLCTLRLAKRLVPHLPSRALGALARHYGIGMEAHHRAFDDAAATADLLLNFLDALEEREVIDWAGLEAFLRKRVGRRRRRRAMPRSMDAA